jgi:hypothetical protein
MFQKLNVPVSETLFCSYLEFLMMNKVHKPSDSEYLRDVYKKTWLHIHRNACMYAMWL